MSHAAGRRAGGLGLGESRKGQGRGRERPDQAAMHRVDLPQVSLVAAYGTAASLAGQLDLRDDQRLLHESLEEEKDADAVLTTLAKSEVNRDALALA